MHPILQSLSRRLNPSVSRDGGRATIGGASAVAFTMADE
jgi:hypothetical protein